MFLAICFGIHLPHMCLIIQDKWILLHMGGFWKNEYLGYFFIFFSINGGLEGGLVYTI